jgi:hypothetical protein
MVHGPAEKGVPPTLGAVGEIAQAPGVPAGQIISANTIHI